MDRITFPEGFLKGKNSFFIILFYYTILVFLKEKPAEASFIMICILGFYVYFSMRFNRWPFAEEGAKRFSLRYSYQQVYPLNPL